MNAEFEDLHDSWSLFFCENLRPEESPELT
jgi:hypothetical protein